MQPRSITLTEPVPAAGLTRCHSIGLTSSVSARGLGRSPRHGHCHDRGPLHDVRPRCVLDTRPPYSGLRPVRAHAFPSNIRSSRRQPETAGSTVFSFEAIPFGPRHRPRVSGGSDGGRLSIIVACGMPAGRWAMRTRAGE
jgi:hypothetical protein